MVLKDAIIFLFLKQKLRQMITCVRMECLNKRILELIILWNWRKRAEMRLDLPINAVKLRKLYYQWYVVTIYCSSVPARIPHALHKRSPVNHYLEMGGTGLT